jgi:hypothetical protein
MSKNEEKALEKELDALENDSVFDFLYCDSGRIGSFLAQFDDSGLLEKVIQRESASRGVKRGLELSVGGGATLAVNWRLRKSWDQTRTERRRKRGQ